MGAPDRSRGKPRQGNEELSRRVGALVEGLTISRVLNADERELVLELADGTRLMVRADGRLDISVT